MLSLPEIDKMDFQLDLERILPQLKRSRTLGYHLRWVCGEPNPPITLVPKILETLKGLGLVQRFQPFGDLRTQWSPTVLGLTIYEEIR